MLRRLSAAALVLVLVSAALTQQPAKRRITETDIFRLVWVADPQPSPDGKRVAFTRVTVNDKGDGYETSIWSVGADGGAPPARMTSGTRDAQPRWSPDCRRVAFVRAPVRDGKPQPPQLFILPLGGGEAWQLTDLPSGVSQAAWSPDGKRIAFITDANDEDLAKHKRERAMRRPVQETAAEEKEEPQRSPESQPGEGSATTDAEKRTPEQAERESDMRTVTRAIYRFDNGGYLDPKRRSHLWVVEVPEFAEKPLEARQLTRGKFEEEDPVWSRDGATIYFSTTRIEEPYYELGQSDVWSVPAAGGEPQKLAALDFDIGRMALSPDGKRVAFVASAARPVRSYSQPDLWVLELAKDAKPRNLSADYDYDVGSGIAGDQRAPRGNAPSLPVWSADGSALTIVVAENGRANLVTFLVAGGKPSAVTRGNHAVQSYRGAGNGAVAAIVSTPTSVGDLFLVERAGAAPRRLTAFNQALFAQLDLSEPEEIWYTSFDGRKIQAWVQKPPDFDPGKKYPLILNIHGGPHAAWGWTFTHEFQWMAARGYIVLYPNPRGSSAYGQEFGNIIQYRYPGDDYKDLMAGVDELVKRGYVDTAKLGVTGGSGGGLLTNWTVTQTDRFRAAVAQRDIADWTAWWYTADFTLFHPNWFRKPPFQDAKDYDARSPLTYVERIRTPLMFVLGEEDHRTPPGAGGEMLFRALKFLKRPTAMVRFPGESHELSRSGQPWRRVERLRAIVGWMDKYLLGKDVAQFRDVTGQEVQVPPQQ